jgi:hypothetical protein
MERLRLLISAHRLATAAHQYGIADPQVTVRMTGTAHQSARLDRAKGILREPHQPLHINGTQVRRECRGSLAPPAIFVMRASPVFRPE